MGDAKKIATLYWCSWWCEEGDHRPVTYPPNEAILGWWHTGYDSAGRKSLVAMVLAKDPSELIDAIRKDWPEFDGEWRFSDDIEHYRELGTRFPLKPWMEERIEDLGEIVMGEE